MKLVYHSKNFSYKFFIYIIYNFKRNNFESRICVHAVGKFDEPIEKTRQRKNPLLLNNQRVFLCAIQWNLINILWQLYFTATSARKTTKNRVKTLVSLRL